MPLVNSLISVAFAKIVVQIVLKGGESSVKTIILGVLFIAFYLVFSLFLGNMSPEKIKKMAVCTKEG